MSHTHTYMYAQHTLSITMHNLPVFTPISCLGEITITIPRPLSHQGWRTGTPQQSSSVQNLSGRCNSCSRFSEYINITHGLLPLPETPADHYKYNSFPFFSSWFSSPSCFTIQANESMFSHRQVHTQLLAFTVLLQYSAPKYSRERLHHNMQTLAVGGGSERGEERLNKVPQSCTTVLQMTGQVADFGTIIAFTLWLPLC